MSKSQRDCKGIIILLKHLSIHIACSVLNEKRDIDAISILILVLISSLSELTTCSNGAVL